MNQVCFHRRDALRAVLGTALAWSPCQRLVASEEKRRFTIGACDWSIGGMGQPAALETARAIGLDGVQVSFGRPGGPNDLRREEVRKEYQQQARQHHVQIASLAMGLLNEVPYAVAPETEQWVADCIEVMPKLSVQVVLLAFFSNGDINGKPELQKEVARRLKKVAPLAEKAGVILGIESWMSADDHLRILDAVGSPAVQVYYDVANSHKMGYDIYREIRQLGRERICEIHCKENESLLGKGVVDFVRVKEAVDEIGYRGWLIIKGATDPALGMRESYVLNQKFLRSIFPTS